MIIVCLLLIEHKPHKRRGFNLILFLAYPHYAEQCLVHCRHSIICSFLSK